MGPSGGEEGVRDLLGGENRVATAIKGNFGLSDMEQGDLRLGGQGGTRGQRASNARQRSVWILSQGVSNCVP